MQGDLFADGVEAAIRSKRSVSADVLPRAGEDGAGWHGGEDQRREDVSSHDPESTPLNSAWKVLAYGELMGFTFTSKLKGGEWQLFVPPAGKLSEDDIAVIRHFKKDLLLAVWTRDVWKVSPLTTHPGPVNS
jgi:hypothetical protein